MKCGKLIVDRISGGVLEFEIDELDILSIKEEEEEDQEIFLNTDEIEKLYNFIGKSLGQG